jgi:hypothetical protein
MRTLYPHWLASKFQGVNSGDEASNHKLRLCLIRSGSPSNEGNVCRDLEQGMLCLPKSGLSITGDTAGRAFDACTLLGERCRRSAFLSRLHALRRLLLRRQPLRRLHCPVAVVLFIPPLLRGIKLLSKRHFLDSCVVVQKSSMYRCVKMSNIGAKNSER